MLTNVWTNLNVNYVNPFTPMFKKYILGFGTIFETLPVHNAVKTQWIQKISSQTFFKYVIDLVTITTYKALGLKCMESIEWLRARTT